ncbi:MAG: protein translocase subunit SecD [Kiritimatiellaeota bacterium]|nr:protein translocase subunit SecD [Kiritimatiellota bacterium]
MKQSLIWRSILVVAVLGAWFASLFPLRDRDYMAEFRKFAEPQVAEYKSTRESAAAEVKALEAKLAKIKDKDSKAYKKLVEKKKEAEARLGAAKRAIEDYQLLQERIKKISAKNPTRPPYLVLKEAAMGGPKTLPIHLSTFVKVPMQPKSTNNQVLSYIRRKSAGRLHLGLDLQGGTEFVIGFDPAKVPAGQTAEQVRDQIIEILRSRVDSMGVVEPEIKPVGPTSISLRMPSVSEAEKADIRRTIKQTAKLEFHMVHKQSDELVRKLRQDPKKTRIPEGYVYKEMQTERDGRITTEGLIIKKRPERVDGADVERAFPMFNQFGTYSVSLQFNGRGAAAFATVTSEHVNERMAIVLDGKVYSAPVIREAITGGSAEISGSFTPQEAKQLAVVLQCGRLPVSINIDSEFGTDPTLGRDSIHSGALAAIWGMVLVVVFMVSYYLFAGLVAVLALCANLLLVLGTLTLAGATITLPGIAGIVLTIGMAVDANVLIFERIREEIRNGKSLGNAINAGYSRAFVTILDSNLTTLLTALILYRFGSGPVRGFAVTLSIGIVASMFTALFMTRVVFDLCLYNGWLKKLRMFSFFKEPKLDFLALRRIAYGLSLSLILLAVGTAVWRGHDALGIDFAGGTAVTFKITAGTPPPVRDLRTVLARQGYTDCKIGYKSSAIQAEKMLEVVFRGKSTGESGFDPEALAQVLNREIKGVTFELVQTFSVGGLVGAQFQKKALYSGVLAVIGIVLYISFRFEFAYAVAAVIALLHDVVIAAGIYLLAGRELSLPVLAALLTIMGYSLNDTIVVFDRIREGLVLFKDRSYTAVINMSINQTLSRTVLTSLTTLLVVLTLFLFGGGAINDFALVMLAGVIVGTYSSVFVASAIVASWHKRVRRATG